MTEDEIQKRQKWPPEQTGPPQTLSFTARGSGLRVSGWLSALVGSRWDGVGFRVGV